MRKFPLKVWQVIGKMVENSVLPIISVLSPFAVFYLPFSVWQNAEFFLLLSAIHGMLYLPYYRQFIGTLSAGESMEKLTIKDFKYEQKYEKVDNTVSLPTGTYGVPLYVDGKFIKYLENA